MNPLRFRSLRRERKTKYPPHHPAMFVAMGVFCIFTAASAWSADEGIKNQLVDQQICKSLNLNDASAIYADEHQTLKTTYDPAQNCEKNAGHENFSYNAVAVDHTPNFFRYRAPFAREIHTPAYLVEIGACRLAYDGIRDLADFFQQQRQTYCDDANSLLQIATQCGAPNDKNCEMEWTDLRHLQKKYKHAITDQSKRALNYLQSLMNAARSARDSYQSDRTKIEAALKRRTGAKEEPAITAASVSLPKITADLLADEPTVKAENGNKATQQSGSLQDYYALLQGADVSTLTRGRAKSALPLTSGPLIVEEEVALKALKNYGDAFQKPLLAYREEAEKFEDWAGPLIDKNKQSSSPTDSGLKKVSNYAPEITSGASATQKLLGSSDSGSTLSSGGSHTPLAAAAAIAGLGAVAAKSFGSGSSGSSASSEAPAVAPSGSGKGEKAAVADLGNGTAPPAAGSGKGGAPVGKGLATTTDTKANAAVAEPSAGGLSGSMMGGEGSSRMLAGKRNAAGGSAPASATAEGGAGAVGDLSSSFAQNLQPKPSPKAAPQSAGSEVANLLGQMKNLFNFDDPTPGGGAPMPGGGAPDIGAASAPVMGGGDMPGGGPDGTADTTADIGPAPGTSSDQLDVAQGSPFGRTDTSLFQRIRARHHRCMERGQVLYGLKERVE